MKTKKNNKNANLEKFEILKEEGQKLTGGFSVAYPSNEMTSIDVGFNGWKCGESNSNCAGGNCVAGCGSK